MKKFKLKNKNFITLIFSSIKFHISLILLFFAIYGLSQASGHPSSIHWKHIQSPYFNIIYPEGRYSEAKRIGNILVQMNENEAYNNKRKNRKIDLILQTHQVIANGYVGIGPYRSEFYATPQQNSFLSTNTDWLDLLAIHEYKHVHQLNDTRVGVTKLASYLLGQGGWAGLKFFAMPDWYAEGNAISAETWLTSGGRGRTPQFLATQKALLLDGKKFRYAQMRGGSFKYDLPDHYVFGHLLYEYVRQKHGPDTWERVIDRSAKYKSGPFYTFSRSLKKETGTKVRGLFKNAYRNYFDQINDQLLENRQLAKANILTASTKTPTFYEYPFKIGNEIYTLKSSFKQTPYISVIKSNKQEKKLTSIGVNSEAYLGYRDSILTWCEYERDPRWAFQNYSNIYYLDLRNGKKTQLTHKSKLFAPDPNFDLQTIVAVKMDTSLQSKIVFVPMETGKPSSEISAFDQGFISFPKWVNDNEIIYFSRLNRVATLYHYNLQTKEHSTIIPPTTHLINHPYVQGNKVIFTATYDGTDQIYSVDLDTKLVHQLTHESIGAYTPNLMGDTLTYQTLISKGADLRQSLISKGKSIDIHERGDIQGDVNIVDDIKNTDYTPSNYNRLWRLQLHSYAPSQNLSTPGIQLYFENALSNIGGTTEIYYNINEKTIQGNTSISLSHRYPVFALNIAPASRASFAFVQDSNKLKRYTFSEMNYGLSTQVPLRWVDGNMSRIFRPSLGINYKHIYNKQVLFTPKALNSFTNISLGLSMSNLRRFAPQNVGTRWGQEININYRASLHGPKGEAFQVRGNVYIPGILQNHRIKIGGEFYKEEFLNTYKFSNNFQYVRGGSALPYNAARRLSLDYGLPLFYPEIGIFDITYFKRIRLNIFGDMAAMKVTSRTLRAQSVGAELYFDNVWMNTLPLTFGARLSYVEEEGDKMWKPELIFALDL